jgi:hypothetical protein
MMILSAMRSISCDMPSKYPSMVDETSWQMQKKTQHSPWLNSEYHGHRYNKNTNTNVILVGE